MRIPKSVKIAGFNYTVERLDDSFVNGCEACDGLHNYHEHIIKVSQRGDESYQHTVFLHELIHAVLECYCDTDILENEEHFADGLAKGLYQIITDNPEIFKETRRLLNE